MKTAGRWPWKSVSAKECVTTHLPNELALKMDGAEANDLNRATAANAMLAVSRRAWGFGVTQRAT